MGEYEMRDWISQEEFSNSVNTGLKLKVDESNSLDFELVVFRDLGSTARQEQFAVEFRGPADTILPQAIYEMQHDAIGVFQIFLVPIRRDSIGVYYEAVFNRFPDGKA